MIRVGLVAPSFRSLSSEISTAVDMIRKSGIAVKFGDVVLSSPTEDPFIRVEEKAREFARMMRDPEVDVLWCADGGWGASRVLPLIVEDWKRNPYKPKVIVGFSDCTQIMQFFLSIGGVCLYGPNATVEVATDVQDIESAIHFLKTGGSCGGTSWHPVNVVNGGTVECKSIVGGCLSSLAETYGISAFGKHEPSESVLFLEEGGASAIGQSEFLFAQNLQRICSHVGCRVDGKKYKGLIVGQVQIVEEYDDHFPSIDVILNEMSGDVTDGPIVYGFPSGHDFFREIVPMGVPTKVEISEMKVRVTWNAEAIMNAIERR